jgi:hypothetical protein
MKKLVFLSAVCSALLFTGCESCSRSMKSLRSDVGGGLNRTISVYDYNGQLIKSWTGKFDVAENPNKNQVYFDDQNGKRVIIDGGIIINEEN